MDECGDSTAVGMVGVESVVEPAISDSEQIVPERSGSASATSDWSECLGTYVVS